MNLSKYINRFEKYNNICIYVCYHGDDSSTVCEFWTDDVLKECDSKKELKKFLNTTLKVKHEFVDSEDMLLHKKFIL